MVWTRLRFQGRWFVTTQNNKGFPNILAELQCYSKNHSKLIIYQVKLSIFFTMSQSNPKLQPSGESGSQKENDDGGRLDHLAG